MKTNTYQRGNFRAEFSPDLPDMKRNHIIKKLEASFKRAPGPIKPKRGTRKGTRAERIARGVKDALELYGTPKAAIAKLETFNPKPASELAATIYALRPRDADARIEPEDPIYRAASDRELTVGVPFSGPRFGRPVTARFNSEKTEQLKKEGWIK